MVLDAQSLEFERNLMRALIISDNKAGHVNQSIALYDHGLGMGII